MICFLNILSFLCRKILLFIGKDGGCLCWVWCNAKGFSWTNMTKRDAAGGGESKKAILAWRNYWILPNIIMDSGVHSTLHEKCHHQIIYSKLNLKIWYPPPYIRKIWDCNLRHSVNRSVEIFDWSYFFSGKNVHEKVELFNKTFFNFIPTKIILFDDKDRPWMNDEIKKIMKRKNWLFECQRKSDNLDYASLNSITEDSFSTSIASWKPIYNRLLGKSNICWTIILVSNVRQ